MLNGQVLGQGRARPPPTFFGQKIENVPNFREEETSSTEIMTTATEFNFFSDFVQIGDKHIEYFRPDGTFAYDMAKQICDNLPGVPKGDAGFPVPESQRENDFYIRIGLRATKL